MDYASLSRKEIVNNVRNIRKLCDVPIKLTLKTTDLIEYLTKYGNNGNIDTLIIDIVGKIACMLDDESFTRFVAAYPRLARNVAKNQNHYQAAFTVGNELCGEYHSFNDQPVIFDSFTRDLHNNCWYRYGKRHRGNDLPAWESKHKSIWYQHNQLIRLSGSFTKRNKFAYSWESNKGYHRNVDKPSLIRFRPKIKETISCSDNFIVVIHEQLKLSKFHNIWDNEMHPLQMRLETGLRIVDDLRIMYILCDMMVELEQYYVNNKLHKINGPAHITNETRIWYNFGKSVKSPKYIELSRIVDTLTNEEVVKYIADMSRDEYIDLQSRIGFKNSHYIQDISKIL